MCVVAHNRRICHKVQLSKGKVGFWRQRKLKGGDKVKVCLKRKVSLKISKDKKMGDKVKVHER